MEQPTAVLPESVSWRLHIDRSMWVAGVRGLMLQALHPVAMQGVWQRSDFMDDPTGRLLRTADFVATTTYGSPEEAEELGARVRAVHRRLRFTDPDSGDRYRVDDPGLLLWVHCAEVVSYLEVVVRAGVRLGPGDADRYFAEQARTAALVGLDPGEVPASAAQMRAYLASVRPRLRAGDEARAAVRFLLWPGVPAHLRALAPFKPLWLPVGALAYYTLPQWARKEYGILPEPPGTQAAATASLRVLRRGLHALPDDIYNRVFDEGTLARARTARRRLEAAGYDVSRGFAGLRDPATWPAAGR
ncbi:oxygenase MpaB family protein [Nocardiopsis suaedae]|uniref:Oxygenase MpaB family protein n=1 Tax=Nocardiopsis suaedae TaxID=3018444 RepID=A0ABT4TV50_9ACTN|nr:oxygenase MpaB family protein [Nocardiopsis suaedae]MDA2808085.1 oxygenase MpaB family protein [Nocardiopsis suaedae]